MVTRLTQWVYFFTLTPERRTSVVRRGARHDEQEVREPVHNLLPRRLAGRHAVPREPDRA